MLLSVFGIIVRAVTELAPIWKIIIFLACLAATILLINTGVKKCYNPKKTSNLQWIYFVFAVIIFIVGLFFVIPLGQLIP